MTDRVKTKKIRWKLLVNEADPDRRRPVLTYVFSKGRKKYGPFDETGRGIYE